MRIVVIAMVSRGAGPAYSFEMTRALSQKRDCEILVIVPPYIENLEKWHLEFDQRSNVKVVEFECYKRSRWSAIMSMFNIRKQNWLIKQIKDFKSDALYVPFGFLWSKRVFKELAGTTRIITTIHDIKLHDSFRNINEYVFSLLNSGSKKHVDDIIVLNQADAVIAREKYKKNVCVIPHAAFSYYIDTQKDHYIEMVNNRIGFVGRIEPYKGLDLLVDAFEMCSTKLELLIAGSGTIDEKSMNRIKENPRVKLINRYLKEEEFEPLISQCDFLVLPYKRASQSGVIPMAYACGRAVIATKVGALNEQISDGTGILVEADALSIAEAIDSMYQKAGLIQEMGVNAYRYSKQYLSWDHSADLLCQLITDKIA